jgi:hypothetical protein
MKKIFFIAVFMTVLISCNKENTTPNNPSQTISDDEKISSIIFINDVKGNTTSYFDTINFQYDNKGRLSKVIFNGLTFGNHIENIKWDVNGNLILVDSLDIKLDNDKNCVFDGAFNYEYKDGYLFRYGIPLTNKIKFIDNNDNPKDTFLICKWENGNLVSDGVYNYEYDVKLLNNSILNSSVISGTEHAFSGNKSESVVNFTVNPYSLYSFGFVYKWAFGKQSKNLVSKVLELDGSLLYDIKYDFDDKNRIIQITHTGSEENFISKYIWSKYRFE